MHLVVNASPLILLCRAGHVALLQQVAGSIVVPRGVLSEVEAQPDDTACASVRNLPWLGKVSVEVPDSIKAWDLGLGESEVVAYALQNNGVRPLLDDAEGKACALAHGLNPLGTGGFLVKAKQMGIIGSVAPVLLSIRSEGLWISDSVIATILRSAGESL